MTRGLLRFAALAMLSFATPAVAADPASAPNPYGDLPPFQLVEEIRGGAFVNDGIHERQSPMATIQLLSSPMQFYRTTNPVLAALLNPRLETGAMVNADGLTSYAFAGVNWRTPEFNRVFGEFGFGGEVNNSSTDQRDIGRIDLGCPATFRESAGLGIDISEHFDIVGSIEHVSHASLCSKHNPGLTSVGLRIGYKF